VDIRLGTCPRHLDRAPERGHGDVVRPAVETFTFEVLNRLEIAVFPPPPKPLTDYSGHWYSPPNPAGACRSTKPDQRRVRRLVRLRRRGQSRWYTIQDGQWTSAARWTGAVYRTSGPPFFAPAFDPAQVTRVPAGQAALDFTQRPGEEGFATFSYTVDGQAGSKRITRLPFKGIPR